MLEVLGPRERRLIERLIRLARAEADWGRFGVLWPRLVKNHYAPSRFKPSQIRQTVAWRIGSDLEARLAIQAGCARPPDYRDELELLIKTKFASRRAFCKASGLSEAMLSHVLARRKHLAVDTLQRALAKVGYTLQLAPAPAAS